MLNTPVLLIVFNRPEETKLVFEKIRLIQPRKLFIAADGPRVDKEGEKELCKDVRSIVSLIDWNCEVKTLFRKENLGCGKSVSGAIEWFFDNVEQGIILEDDCLPDQSFFTFCENLLEYYKNEPRVMHIGGTNSQFGKVRNKYSYYFSKYPHIWGWATWRHSWRKYKYSFTNEDEKKLDNVFKSYCFNEKEIEYWKHHWVLVNGENKINTWDIQWTFTCWFNNGITIVPNTNLITNIGFNSKATHTKSDSKLANIPSEKIGYLKHPTTLIIDTIADDYTFTKYNLHKQPLHLKLREWVVRWLPKPVKDKLKKAIR